MNLRQTLRDSASRLEKAGMPSAMLDAQLLMQEALGATREALLLRADEVMSAAEQQRFDALLSRRLAREPVSHILGRREFWGMEFKVSGDVLDPRPDSETLVQAVLSALEPQERAAPLTLLDLGTGSGCLLLALLSELPGASGLGVDKSLKALEIAKFNAEKHGLAKRVQFQHGDWNSGISSKFDVVISNPPYIKANDLKTLSPEVRDYEPISALDGGEDGLDCYRIIISTIAENMTPQGLLALEIGEGQGTDISAMLAKDFTIITIAKDLASIARCIVARRRS